MSVRLTGEKGYVTLDKKTAEAFKSDVGYTLQVLDLLAKLVAEKNFEACA